MMEESTLSVVGRRVRPWCTQCNAEIWERQAIYNPRKDKIAMIFKCHGEQGYWPVPFQLVKKALDWRDRSLDLNFIRVSFNGDGGYATMMDVQAPHTDLAGLIWQVRDA